MEIIEIEGSEWKKSEEFYKALLEALGAPETLGYNLDAIYDSVGGNDINKITAPFRVRVFGLEKMPIDVSVEVMRVSGFMIDLQSKGIDVGIVIDPSNNF